MRALCLALSLLIPSACMAAEGCTPLLPFEQQTQKLLEEGVFNFHAVVPPANGQVFLDKLTQLVGVSSLPDVEAIHILVHRGMGRVAIFPLQRDMPNGDLVNCHFLILGIEEFNHIMKAMKGEVI